MMLGLAGAGTIVSMPRFDMQEFLTIVQKYRATILPLVPPIVLGLVKHPAVAQFDLSSVRLVFSGAAPLGEEMARALSQKLGCPVVQGYGMTEASPVTHLSPTHNAPFKPGSAGRIVPNTEVKIVEVGSGGDAELPVGKEGELWIRGPQIMKGYLNRPEETAGCLDRDGWYHTGDVGYVDDEGYFFIVDRTKELIKYKGMQVAPAELEGLLLEFLSDFQITIPELGTIRAKRVPHVVITSNRTRELSDALKRRCLYLYIGYPSREKEVAILRVKVPGLGEQFAEEIAGFVQRVRAEDDFVKRPGISETLEWASALMTLGTTKLDRDIVEQTLGLVVKDAQDLQTMQSGRLDALLGSP